MVLSSSLAQNMKLLEMEKKHVQGLMLDSAHDLVASILTKGELEAIAHALESERELRTFRDMNEIKLLILLHGVVKNFPVTHSEILKGILKELAEKSRANVR